jgi:sugar phosphate isomerase/epimerase
MYRLMEHIVASATGGDSKKSFEEVLGMYSKMGYPKFELYATGRGSSLDLTKGTDYYLQMAQKYGITYSSLHLAPVEADLGATLDQAVQCALFGEKLGVSIVVFNATERGHYAEALKRFIKATAGHQLIPMVQIHKGRSIQTLEEVLEILETVNDPHVKVLHEVGSYHEIGVHWKTVCDQFKQRIALVHVKDMIGALNVPFGKGEIDLPALFKEMRSLGYEGDYVVEMATKDRENTTKYIADAFQYIKNNCQSAS